MCRVSAFCCRMLVALHVVLECGAAPVLSLSPVCMHVSRLTRARAAVSTCQVPSTAASNVAVSLPLFALHTYAASWPVVLVAADGSSCQHAAVWLDRATLVVLQGFSAARGNLQSPAGACNIVCTSQCAVQSSGHTRLLGANIRGC